MIFKKLKPGRMRVLLNAGGIIVKDGVSKKMPCRWADFRDKDTIQINNPDDIALIKKASGYGKEFVMLPAIRDDVKKETKIENPLKDKKPALVED